MARLICLTLVAKKIELKFYFPYRLLSSFTRWLGGAAVERSALDQQAAGGPQVQFPASRLQKVVLPLISE